MLLSFQPGPAFLAIEITRAAILMTARRRVVTVIVIATTIAIYDGALVLMLATVAAPSTDYWDLRIVIVIAIVIVHAMVIVLRVAHAIFTIDRTYRTPSICHVTTAVGYYCFTLQFAHAARYCCLGDREISSMSIIYNLFIRPSPGAF